MLSIFCWDAVQALPELQSDKDLMTGSSRSTPTGALSAVAGMHHLIADLRCHTCDQWFVRAEPAAVLLMQCLASCQLTSPGLASCLGARSHKQLQPHICTVHNCTLLAWRAHAPAWSTAEPLLTERASLQAACGTPAQVRTLGGAQGAVQVSRAVRLPGIRKLWAGQQLDGVVARHHNF